MHEFYHMPVLCRDVAHYLLHKTDGTYVDGTLGGGGHAAYLLERLDKNARYIGLDQDSNAIRHTQNRLAGFFNVFYAQANFKDTYSVLEKLNIQTIDGFFLDLGISSHQIDTPERGFTYMTDGPLDMRMDQRQSLTAKDMINTFTETDLKKIFRDFGEERFAGPIARQICRERTKHMIQTSAQLCRIIDRVVSKKHVIKTYSRIFQALRIAVNEELSNLEFILHQSLSFIRSTGRLVIISYHSLEDRIVKTFLKKQEDPCECPPELPQCVCGKQPRMRILTRRAVRADSAEVKINSRARSALLRAGEVL